MRFESPDMCCPCYMWGVENGGSLGNYFDSSLGCVLDSSDSILADFVVNRRVVFETGERMGCADIVGHYELLIDLLEVY